MRQLSAIIAEHVKTLSLAKRLIIAGAVKINGCQEVNDVFLDEKSGDVITIGKKNIITIHL